MINKLRRRFILVAMLSTAVVLVAIVGGMNIMNYRQLQADADRINKMITDNNGTFPNNNGGDRNAPKPRDDNQSSDGGSTDQQDTTGKLGDGSTDNQRPDGNQPPEPPQRGKQNGGSNPGQPGTPGKQPSGDMGEMSPEAPFETRYFSVVLDASGKVTSTNLNNIAAVSEDQAEELAQKVMKAGESKGFIGIYRYAKAAQSDGTLIAFTDCNKALDTFYKNVRISGLVSLAGVVAVFVLVVIFSRLVFRPVAESYQKQKQLITLSKMDEGDGMADKMRFSMTDAVIVIRSAMRRIRSQKEIRTCSLNGFIAVMSPEIRRQVEAVLDFLLQRQWQRRIMAS